MPVNRFDGLGGSTARPAQRCKQHARTDALAVHSDPAAKRLFTGNMTQAHERLDARVDARVDEEVRFQPALVQLSTDTPPGDNAPHAERTAELLATSGFTAEKQPVPAAEVQAHGMPSITDRVVRRHHGQGRPLDQGLVKPDFLLAAGFRCQVVTAHNGCLQMEVTVLGKTVHAATADTGIDALQGAAAI